MQGFAKLRDILEGSFLPPPRKDPLSFGSGESGLLPLQQPWVREQGRRRSNL